MSKLTMGANPDKATVNNSPEKTVGIDLYLDQITMAEPFASLFVIRQEVLEAIKSDMTTRGFDPSKPVNVWRKPDGMRVLIDGYTRVRAASELGFMKVTAYETSFNDESEALAYAIHTQRDRRNLTDAELLHLVEIVDRPQVGFKASIAPNGAIGEKPRKTAEITADEIGISPRGVERARTVLADPDEALAVKEGRKSISQAAKDAVAKRQAPAASTIADQAKRVLAVLIDLSKRDEEDRRRVLWVAAAEHVRQGLLP